MGQEFILRNGRRLDMEKTKNRWRAEVVPSTKSKKERQLEKYLKKIKTKYGPLELDYEEYREFLRSDYWKDLRKRKLQEVGNKCELCGRKDSLQVHHLNYETVGREELSDLKVVCADCHKYIHKIERPCTTKKIRYRNK